MNEECRMQNEEEVGDGDEKAGIFSSLFFILHSAF